MGVRKGACDLFIPEPTRHSHGLWIELKAGNNKLREEQKQFIEDMLKRGYTCFTCWTLEQFMESVKVYFDETGSGS